MLRFNTPSSVAQIPSVAQIDALLNAASPSHANEAHGWNIPYGYADMEENERQCIAAQMIESAVLSTNWSGMYLKSPPRAANG